MTYQEIKEVMLKKKKLFEDRDFPAVPRSVYFSKTNPFISWKRPHEIVKDPKFMVDGACRFDFDQGEIGNCWYIAGAATLASRPELLKNVVPDGQTFDKENYAGIFHFNFWRFGRWVEVVIDDRLPCNVRGRLLFCKNKDQGNEFWTALLEKAYAKLHGSYEALEGGWTEDAYVDFTGGIGQRIDLKDKSKIPPNLFQILMHDYTMNSLMACSISATKDTMEAILDNGLVIGHAYSITKVSRVKIGDKTQHLIRVRNPWGQKEWKGAWSDQSKEWKSLSEAQHQSLGIINDEDGEFWMSFDDWSANFEQLQVCHLPASNLIPRKRAWTVQEYHGAWVKGVSAGGCGNPPNRDRYWTNPQYSITLKDIDKEDGDNKCTLIVSLMQKHARAMRTQKKQSMANQPISFDLYKLKQGRPKLLQGQNYDQSALKLDRRGGAYAYFREITQEFKLDPGNYVIIPATFEVDVEMEFLLRMYTESDSDSMEMDVDTEPVMRPKESRQILQELFLKYSGDDGVVDARELQLILNAAFAVDLGADHKFELEACRSMLAMMDRNQSGVLELGELNAMWHELTTWQSVFKQFDRDDSGFIDIKELQTIFKSIGYSLSRNVLTSIVRRYAGKGDTLAFNDFIMVLTKVVALMGEEQTPTVGEQLRKHLPGAAVQITMLAVGAAFVILGPIFDTLF